MTEDQDFKAEIAWLKEAAKYFLKRPTNGEDQAHWSNVYNSQIANAMADRLSAMESKDD